MSEIANTFVLAEELLDFFGKPANKVNWFIRFIALNLNCRAEWLRGACALTDLPRYKKNGGTDWTLIPTRKRHSGKLAKDVVWIIESMSGFWTMNEAGFSFEKSSEAVLFKVARF